MPCLRSFPRFCERPAANTTQTKATFYRALERSIVEDRGTVTNPSKLQFESTRLSRFLSDTPLNGYNGSGKPFSEYAIEISPSPGELSFERNSLLCRTRQVDSKNKCPVKMVQNITIQWKRKETLQVEVETERTKSKLKERKDTLAF